MSDSNLSGEKFSLLNTNPGSLPHTLSNELVAPTISSGCPVNPSCLNGGKYLPPLMYFTFFQLPHPALIGRLFYPVMHLRHCQWLAPWQRLPLRTRLDRRHYLRRTCRHHLP